MLSGHLQEKNGVYYAVISYYDSMGERHQVWKNTGLTIVGNKRRALKILEDLRQNFEIPKVTYRGDNVIR